MNWREIEAAIHDIHRMYNYTPERLARELAYLFEAARQQAFADGYVAAKITFDSHPSSCSKWA